MKKLTTLASSLVLSVAAGAAHAAIYDVTVDVSGVVSGGGGGTQTGSGYGTYDDSTQVMTLTTDATVVANGLFGFGKGTMDQTFTSYFDFDSLSGTNQVTSCSNISGTACSLTPTNAQTLDSVSPIDWNAMTFTTVSTYTIATTTQNWTITSFESQSQIPVPAAAWLFGSALLGLTGVARRKNAA